MSEPSGSQSVAPRPLPPREWARLVVLTLFMGAILFLAAWDFRWWQAWAYFALMLAAGLGGRIWAEVRHPGLMAERANSLNAEGVQPWDKVLAPLLALSTSFAIYIVAGLDRRFHGSPAFPGWLTVFGLALIALGYAVTVWATAENRFFSGVVRIQTDRGHTVCDTGPYRVVRHPGYAGYLLSVPGMLLAFASLWAIIPAVLALAVIVTRTALEDRTLREELPGYREYTERTRYRLLPGIF